MIENIYANSGISEDNKSTESNDSYEDIYMNEDVRETQVTRSHKETMTSGDTESRRCYKHTAVCVVLLCVLLLTAITVLCIIFNNNLNAEKQLQTSYNNLTIERDQLKRDRDELQRFSKLGWIYFSSRFYFISIENKMWNESRQHCNETGADLVIIKSKEEQEFISKLLGSRKAWIGLNDRDREGVWTWVDGTPLTIESWRKGEPNSAAGDEDCVLAGALTDPLRTWADYPCNDRFSWICEKTVTGL